ncbi:MAG: PEGA domain protein [Methanoregula sp. PtaU1.Bin051]|nr:MAG: PEGA domain protein [Methanoregula sp. PtaU1.Bin051]
MGTLLNTLRTKGAALLLLVIILIPSAVTAYNNSSLALTVKDAATGESLHGAMVYLDGRFRGVEESEVLVLNDIPDGSHTLRITKTGYRDAIKKVVVPGAGTAEIRMEKGSLFDLSGGNPAPRGINIVFIPSGTSYDCSARTKIPSTTYTTDETRFREDVLNVINRTFLNLEPMTSPAVPLPADYEDRFNFYYYYNASEPADAFSGCAGRVPDSYWSEVTFADLTVILYPSYVGQYNASCQPAGCYLSSGSGRRVMKVPADKPSLISHEAGHGLYGLVDTYCGDTYYYENAPNANVWSSLGSCTTDAARNNRNATDCRLIEQQYPSSCTTQFYRWDPDPDIMRDAQSGKFGVAATQRIGYVLEQTGGGRS